MPRATGRRRPFDNLEDSRQVEAGNAGGSRFLHASTLDATDAFHSHGGGSCRKRRRRPWGDTAQRTREGAIARIFCAGAVLAAARTPRFAAAATAFNIGVLVPWHGASVDGPSAIAATALAAAAVNEAELLPDGYTLRWAWADPGPGCDPGSTAAAAAALTDGYAIDALVGSDCAATDEHISTLAGIRNLTVAGWAPSASELSDDTAYPNYFRTVGTTDALADAVVALAAHFGWEAMALFYATGGRDGSRESQASELRALLETAGVTVDPFLAFGAFNCGNSVTNSGFGGGFGDWAGTVAAAAATMDVSGRSVGVIIGACDDYRRWATELSKEGLLDGKAWILFEAQHPRCHSLADLCGSGVVDKEYPAADDSVALAALAGVLSVGFGGWGSDSPGGYGDWDAFAAAVASTAADQLADLLPPPKGTATLADSAAFAAAAPDLADDYDYPYDSALEAASVDRYARFLYDAVTMLAVAASSAAAAGNDLSAATSDGGSALVSAASDVSYSSFLSGALSLSKGQRQASTIEILSLSSGSAGATRRQRQRGRRRDRRHLLGARYLEGAALLSTSAASYVVSDVVAEYDTSAGVLTMAVADADVAWPGGGASVPPGDDGSGGGGGGMSSSAVLLLCSGLLLAAGAGVCGVCFVYNRRTRLKVHALEAAEKDLREKNSRLEEYARPPTHQAVLVERSMGEMASEEQRLLESVELEAERLDIGEVVGAGSSAEVRRGSYRGTPVAIKMLKHVDEQSLQRFKAEILLMKDLRHPNIVLLIGASWKTGRLMMVTEFFERGNLADVLNDRSLVLTWQAHKYRMVTDIVRGMGYLHSARYYDQATKSYQSCIMHRDLKPQNMLVTATLGIKITDFGEARLIDDEFTMTQVGTLLYIAPEIVRGDRYDEKCDVYSFAMVLLSMLQIKRHVFECFVEALRERRNLQRAGLLPPPPDPAGGAAMPAGAPWGPTGGGGGGNNARYTPHMVTVAVVNEDLRPVLPPDVYPSVAMLMEQSWDRDPARRPSFKEILEFVETICKEDIFGAGDNADVRWKREREELMAREAREREERMHRDVAEKVFERHGVRRASAPPGHDGGAKQPAAGPVVHAAGPSAHPYAGAPGAAAAMAAAGAVAAPAAAAESSPMLSYSTSEEERARVPVRIAPLVAGQAAQAAGMSMQQQDPRDYHHGSIAAAGAAAATAAAAGGPATLGAGGNAGGGGAAPSAAVGLPPGERRRPEKGGTALDMLMANNMPLRERLLALRQEREQRGSVTGGAIGGDSGRTSAANNFVGGNNNNTGGDGGDGSDRRTIVNSNGGGDRGFPRGLAAAKGEALPVPWGSQRPAVPLGYGREAEAEGSRGDAFSGGGGAVLADDSDAPGTWRAGTISSTRRQVTWADSAVDERPPPPERLPSGGGSSDGWGGGYGVASMAVSGRNVGADGNGSGYGGSSSAHGGSGYGGSGSDHGDSSYGGSNSGHGGSGHGGYGGGSGGDGDGSSGNYDAGAINGFMSPSPLDNPSSMSNRDRRESELAMQMSAWASAAVPYSTIASDGGNSSSASSPPSAGAGRSSGSGLPPHALLNHGNVAANNQAPAGSVKGSFGSPMEAIRRKWGSPRLPLTTPPALGSGSDSAANLNADLKPHPDDDASRGRQAGGALGQPPPTAAAAGEGQVWLQDQRQQRLQPRPSPLQPKRDEQPGAKVDYGGGGRGLDGKVGSAGSGLGQAADSSGDAKEVAASGFYGEKDNNGGVRVPVAPAALAGGAAASAARPQPHARIARRQW